MIGLQGIEVKEANYETKFRNLMYPCTINIKFKIVILADHTTLEIQSTTRTWRHQ